MSGKVYKKINLELTLALEQFNKGEIDRNELSKVYDAAKKEYLATKEQSNKVAFETDFLGFIFQG